MNAIYQGCGSAIRIHFHSWSLDADPGGKNLKITRYKIARKMEKIIILLQFLKYGKFGPVT